VASSWFFALLNPQKRGLPVTGLSRDLVLAWRRLIRAPVFTAFSVLTLAIGIGAVTAIYSVVHTALGPPPGVAQPGRLTNVRRATFGSGPIVTLSWPDFQSFRQQQTSFSSVTGWTYLSESIVADGGTLTGWGEVVDGDYFSTLGVPAWRGRMLTQDDDQPGAPAVAVINFAVWQRLFGGSEDAIGKIVVANGQPVRVVGVAPREFAGMFNGGLVRTLTWRPLAAARTFTGPNSVNFDPNSRSHRWVFVQGRLAPGHTLTQANTEIAALGQQFDAALEAESGTPTTAPGMPRLARLRTSWNVRPATRIMGVPDQILKPLVAALAIAVGLVLLVACTNLTNLMLARHGRRRAELAVRVAIGASRARLVRQVSMEAVMLALAGGLASLGVARVLMRVLSTEVRAGSATLQVLPRVDLAALSAALLATLLALCVTGLLPALQATRLDLRSALATDTGTTTPRWRGRRLLITFQVAASVLLVSICTLYIGEIQRQGRVDTGFALDHLALAHVNFQQQRYDDARARQIAEAALAQVAERPDVESVGLSAGFPLGLNGFVGGLATSAGRPRNTSVQIVAGTPSLLKTLGVQIRRGRGIDDRDTRGAQPVAVITETTGEQLFGGADPIGREVTIKTPHVVGEAEIPDRTATIVGVTADTDASYAGQRQSGVIYLSLDQQPGANLVLAARSTSRPDQVASALRRAIASVDPTAAVSESGTGRDVVGPDTIFQRVVAGISGSLGITALVLAVTGLYGVLSHIITGRRREFGVRLALGADAGRIRRMVVLEGLRPVILGLAAGLGLGAIARASMRPVFLRLVPATDATLIVLVPLLFLAAGVIASYIPALRASKVDPNVALRNL
jgi:predicted permease